MKIIEAQFAVKLFVQKEMKIKSELAEGIPLGKVESFKCLKLRAKKLRFYYTKK